LEIYDEYDSKSSRSAVELEAILLFSIIQIELRGILSRLVVIVPDAAPSVLHMLSMIDAQHHSEYSNLLSCTPSAYWDITLTNVW
jgi:hypothetical protein